MVKSEVVGNADIGKENALVTHLNQKLAPSNRENISEYVAHLQLHMTLQARNLVPPLTQAADSREQLLHQTQALCEKEFSRQS